MSVYTHSNTLYLDIYRYSMNTSTHTKIQYSRFTGVTLGSGFLSNLSQYMIHISAANWNPALEKTWDES